MQEITLPELPSGDGGKVIIRKKRQRLPARLFAVLVFAVALTALAALGISKLKSGELSEALAGKLSSLFPSTGFGSTGSVIPGTGEAPEPPEGDDLSASLPTSGTEESSGEESHTASPEESTNVAPDTEEPPLTEASEATEPEAPKGQLKIVEEAPEESYPKLLNLTSRSFSSGIFLESSVIPVTGRGPLVLIIHTNTSEGYLAPGTKYYDPSSPEAHDGSVVKAGEALASSLSRNGIPVLHIKDCFDGEGSSKAYIKSRNKIREVLADNPSIKYVIDLGRGFRINKEGALSRTFVDIQGKSYAPISLTVSAGESIPRSDAVLDLSLALRLNELLADYSVCLAQPVVIADGVYNAGLVPRTLKADVGSLASTLEEATLSASLLGELLSLLING